MSAAQPDLTITQWYGEVQESLYRHVVEPLLFQLNWIGLAEDAYDGVEWFMLGVLQIAIIVLVLRTWERVNPAENQGAHVKAKWPDVAYTLFHRLGFFQMFIFFAFSGLFFQMQSVLHDWRFERLNVEDWWPGVTTIPLVSFCIYLVMLDFVEYVYHRASHRFQWWWQLHTLHHSQVAMNAWSDDRNHVVDDIMHALVFAFFALLFGVSPGQFVFLVVVGQLIESWQHANLKIHLGLGRYFLISPMFHRMHHAVGYGHEAKGKPGVLGGCNFGVLFPWWDMLFKTAIFPNAVYPTGVRGLSVPNSIWSQQWQGLRHAYLHLFHLKRK